MNGIVDFILFESSHHPDPANDPDQHTARVSDARVRLAEKYLCHPANHVKPIWRGPCQPENTTA